MNVLTKKVYCLLRKENIFLIRLLEKSIEYDSGIDNSKEAALEELINQLNQDKEVIGYILLPEYKTYPRGKEFHLFGNRVHISFDIHYYYGLKVSLKIDSYKIDFSDDFNGKYSLGDTEHFKTDAFDRVNYFLSQIATYGVEDFMANYKDNLFEKVDKLEQLVDSLLDDTEREKLKKKLIQLIPICFQLKMWQPLGKTNEEMEELMKRFDNLFEKQESHAIY